MMNNSLPRLRHLSRILGPFLVGAYPFLWAGGLFFAFCNDYPPTIRWCAGLATVAPLVLAWRLFRRPYLPEGWYRPSKILVVFVALLCLVATPVARIPDYALTDASFLGSSANDPSRLEVLYPVSRTEQATDCLHMSDVP